MNLNLRAQCPKQPARQRYDEGQQEKFDYKTRFVARTKLYRETAHFMQEMDEGGAQGPTEGALGLAVADINLRTRGLVGLVLGSIVRDIYDAGKYVEPYRALSRLDGHHDIDVLILQTHSANNPRPHEWGIDWWVRPDGRAPTNSSIDLWYDISMKRGLKTGSGISDPRHLILQPNFEAGEVELKKTMSQIRERSAQINREIHEVYLPAGLYVPDASTMDRIRLHVNERKVAEKQKMLDAFQKIRAKLPTVHSLHKTTYLISKESPGYEQKSSAEKNKIDDENKKEVLVYLISVLTEIIVDLLGIYRHMGLDPERLNHMMRITNEITEKYNPHYFEKIIEYWGREFESIFNEINREYKHYNRNYDYLDVRDKDAANSLYPVLPDHLLDFKAL